jgi:hypothetical protein
MPIVAKSEMDRRRALAQIPSTNVFEVRSDRPVEARVRRAPIKGQEVARPDGEPEQTSDPLWPEGSLSAGRDYDAGKYRPPIDNRFQKGTSGNPSGRPKKSLDLKTIVRAAMAKKVDLRDATGKRRVAMIEALIQKLIELATKGNLRAIDALLKLYALAVPEVTEALNAASADRDLTAADQAGLALLRDIILAEGRPEPDGEDVPC